jgi:hypothetical protein
VCPVESVFCVCCVAKLIVQDENVVNLVGLSYFYLGLGGASQVLYFLLLLKTVLTALRLPSLIILRFHGMILF